MVIIGLIFVLLTLFSSFVFLVINTIKEGQRESYTIKTVPAETLKRIEGQGDHRLSGTNPKVTIVEFADFGCSMCKSSYPKIRSLKTKYKDDIEIIFRDFPVVTEASSNLALAAHCAGEQGLFWVMHDKLFDNQGISTQTEIFSLAAEIGVEANEFTTCFENGEYMDRIYSNYSDGTYLGVSGTPSFFVNGEMISGDIPLETWYKIIDYILENN